MFKNTNETVKLHLYENEVDMQTTAIKKNAKYNKNVTGHNRTNMTKTDRT